MASLVPRPWSRLAPRAPCPDRASHRAHCAPDCILHRLRLCCTSTAGAPGRDRGAGPRGAAAVG
eukprot:351395-Chlamydomonas_euryale.AAC.1